MKKLLIGFAAVVVILIGAVVAAPFLVPTDAVVDRVRQALREQTGRELTVSGPVDLSFFPTVRVRIDDVALANVPDGRAASLATLGRLEAELSLTDLIGGTVSVERFILIEPVIALEIDADGRPNWVFGPAEDAAADGPATAEGGGGTGAGGFAPGEVRLGTVRLVDGRVSFHDARTGEEAVFESVDASVDMPTLDDRLRAEGSASFRGEPVTLALDVAVPRAILEGGTTDLAVDLDSAPVTLTLIGAAGIGAAPAVSGTASLDVPSIAALRSLVPVALPEVPVESVAFDGTVDATPDRVALGGFTLTADATTASGDLTVVLDGPRPVVSGAVALSALDLDALLRDEAEEGEPAPAAEDAAEADVDTDAEAGPGAEEPPAASSGDGADGAIDFSPLRLADIDLTVDLGGLTVEGTEIGPTTLAIALLDGVLDARLSEAAVFDGTVAGSVRIDSAASTPTVAVDAAIASLSLGPPLRSFAGMPDAAGTLTLDLTAEGQGATRQALADSLTGSAVGRLTEGAFSLADPHGGEPIALTGVDVAIDLPGIDGPLSATGAATVRGEPATFDATVAAPRALLAGAESALAVSLSAPAIALTFDGRAAVGDAPSAAGVVDLDIPSIAGLAERAAVALPPGLPIDRLAVSGALEASPTLVSLTGGQVDADSLTASGDLRADLSGAVPSVFARLRTGPIDVDSLTAPAEAEAAAAGSDGTEPPGEPAPAPAPSGWSEEPFDLSALRAATIDAVVEAAGVTVDGIDIGPTTVTVLLADGVLDLSIPDAPVFGGRLGLDLGIDTNTGPPAFDIAGNVRGVEIEPVLRHFADTDRLSGTTEATVNLTARGASQAALVRSLNGTAATVFRDGALKGVNVAAMLRNIGSAFTNSQSGDARSTDFAELGGNFVVTDGVAVTDSLRMLAPLFRIEGSGATSIPERSLDFRLEPKAVATIEGQGGQFEETGVRVPILVTGTWSEPRFAPDLAGLIRGTLEDPAAIGEQLRNLGGGGGAEDVLRGVLEGGVGGLLGGGGDAPAAEAPAAEAPAGDGTGTGGEAAPQAPAPAEEPAPTPQDRLREQLEQAPVDALRGLFGN